MTGTTTLGSPEYSAIFRFVFFLFHKSIDFIVFISAECIFYVRIFILQVTITLNIPCIWNASPAGT